MRCLPHVLCLTLLSCAEDRTVTVKLGALPQEVRSLRVRARVDGQWASALAELPPEREFSLVLSRRGQLAVGVEAFGEGGTLVQRGHGILTLGDEETYELPVLLAEESCGVAGLCWQHPIQSGLPGTSLRSVAASDPNNVWVVGDGGTILRRRSGAWAPVRSGTTKALYGVWSEGADATWAVGEEGTRLRWDGSAFSPEVEPAIDKSLYAVWGNGSGDLWAVGAAGTCVHRGGGRWEAPRKDCGAQDLYAVWGTPQGVAWAVGKGGALLAWGDGGWQSQVGPDRTTADLSAVWVSDTGKVYVGGDRGVFHERRLDGWTPIGASAPMRSLQALWGNGAGDLWAGAGDGSLLRRNGMDMTVSTSGDNRQPIQDVRGGDGQVWAVGNGATVLRNAAGSGWVADGPVLTSQVVSSLAGSGPQGDRPVSVWAVGAGAAVLRWDGIRWTRERTELDQLTATKPELNDAWVSPDGTVWIVGDDGTLLRGGEGALLKVREPLFTGTTLRGIWGSAPDDVWVVGTRRDDEKAGVALHLRGETWVNEGAGLGRLYAVWGGGADDVWAVGADGNVCHRGADGAWRTEKLGSTAYHAVWGANGEVFIAGDGGTLLRRAAGVYGLPEWSELPTGVTAGLTGVWGSREDDVWVTGASGTLLRWNGSVVAQVPTGVGGGLRAVWGAGPNEVWIAGPEYAVLRRRPDAWGEVVVPVKVHGLRRPWVHELRIEATLDDKPWPESQPYLVPYPLKGDRIRLPIQPGSAGTLRLKKVEAVGALPGEERAVFGLNAEPIMPVMLGPERAYSVPEVAIFTSDPCMPGTWCPMWGGTRRNLRSIWGPGPGPGKLWAAGQGVLLFFDGQVWTPQAIPEVNGADLFELWGSSADDVWAVGFRGEYEPVALHYDGQRWERKDHGGKAQLYGVWGNGLGDVWMVGARPGGGVILQWDGAAIREVATSPGELDAVFGFGQDVWAVGHSFLRRQNGSWKVETEKFGTYAAAMYGDAGTKDLWLAGDGGAIWRWDSKNMVWSQQMHGKTTANLRAIWMGISGVWFAGGAGTLLRNDGAVMNPWSVEPSGTKVFLAGFWASDRDFWTVGDGGAILRRPR